MWQDRFHQHLDGAIATDPTALSYLLKATGPVQLPGGGSLTASNAVAFFESGVYAKFGSDTAARKAFQVQAAQAVATAVIHQRSADLLASAEGLEEGRRRASAPRLHQRCDNRASAIGQPVGGAIPVTSAAFPRRRRQRLGGQQARLLPRTQCHLLADPRARRVRPRSPSCCIMLRRRPDCRPTSRVGAATRCWCRSTAPRTRRSRTQRSTARPPSSTPESENGHPVTIAEVPLKAGQTRTLVFHVHEPAATGPLMTLTQPLVRPLKLTVNAPTCPSTG